MENREASPLILSYLKRSALPYSLPETVTVSNLGQVIVIPCFEEPEIQKTLQGLSDCQQPENAVLVILVLNQPASFGKNWSFENQKSKLQIINASKETPPWLQMVLIEAKELPEKKAGVGLARKIGMDLASRVLVEKDFPSLPIVCLDADCTVESNYLIAIEDHFLNNPKTPACSIHFEHSLESNNTSAIQFYELQLRYYVAALNWAGFPYSFQTVGSSMAVRAHIYAKQGGMNQRKAGEDFYFLHKIIPLGNFTELNSTKVIPSDRISRRVPFGTGRAMEKYESGMDDLSQYYDLKIFEDLRTFLSKVSLEINSEEQLKELFPNLPKTVKEYIGDKNWHSKIKEIFQNAASPESRTKRFFSWIDAFWILKFTHYCRDSFYPNSDLLINASKLLKLLENENDLIKEESVLWLLNAYRLRQLKKG